MDDNVILKTKDLSISFGGLQALTDISLTIEDNKITCLIGPNGAGKTVFLNCLNGVSSNEGVVTIATTNYPENLDLALTDRPGRFDLKIVMDLPNSKARQYILLKYLEEFDCEDLNIDKIVNNTKMLFVLCSAVYNSFK